MSYLKTKGIVIREVSTGEADKMVTIFTTSKGKISAFAKNAKKSSSRFIAATQFLCYSDFVLFKHKDMYLINSCEVIEPFYESRNDLVKLTFSAHLTDLVNDVVQENQAATKLLRLFLNSRYMLAKTDKSPELITVAFDIKLLSVSGYTPFTDGCVTCGDPICENGYFSFTECGVMCNNCGAIRKDVVPMSIGTLRAINHIVKSNISNLFGFELSVQVLNELKIISTKYLNDRLERYYTKLDFLKSIK